MLRINLLPPYIYEGAKRRNVTVLWVIILLAVIGGFVWAKSNIDGQTKEWTDKESAIAARADQADRMAQEATNINNASATIRGKADFVRNARKHDTTTYQEVLTNVARYTWPRVLYDGIRPEGQAITLPAYAPSLADVGHYMIYMERNPNIQRVDVQIASIPGFGTGPAGGNQQQATGVRPLTGGGHDFTAVLTLNKPIDAGPGYGGGGGGATGGGAPTGGSGAPTFGGGFGGSGGPGMSGSGGGGMSSGGAMAGKMGG